MPLHRVRGPQEYGPRGQQHHEDEHHEDGVHDGILVSQPLLHPVALGPHVLGVVGQQGRIGASHGPFHVDLEGAVLLVVLYGGGDVVGLEVLAGTHGVHGLLVVVGHVHPTAGPALAPRVAVAAEDHVVPEDARAVEDAVVEFGVVDWFVVAFRVARGEGYVVARFVLLVWGGCLSVLRFLE